MQVRCPHCQNALELVDESPLVDIECPSCGNRFNLTPDTIQHEQQHTLTYRQERPKSLAHFEVLERLGVGSFGAVWKALDTKLDRVVAIKIPRKEHFNGDQAELFVREARAAAQLTHPNIVSVHEVGREGGQLYIVSDFVDGVTLGDWLTGKQPTTREAVDLCATIAEALDVAHEAGVVHRDLKPSNIMLDDTGAPHIMDFGLAKRDAGEITITLQGKVLGTPAYMSPEQAAGESHQADRRSDVYSIGVILFQMLTGERPFRGNTRMLIHQVINDDPPSPRKLDSTVPRDLETICLKCLEKSPARRYATAGELADDMRRYLDDKPIQAHPPSVAYRARKFVTRHRAAVISVAAIIVLLIAGTTGTSWGWVTALHAADREEQAKETAQQRGDNLKKVVDFHSSMLAQIDPAVMGHRILVDERRRIQERLEKDKASQEAIASALTSFDELASHINATDLARQVTVDNFLEPGVNAINRDFADQLLVRAALLQTLAIVYQTIGLYESAVPLQKLALNIRRAKLGNDDPDTLISISTMGSLLRAMGKLTEAQAYDREALEGCRRALGDDHAVTLTSINNMGLLVRAMGKLAEAELYYREALDGRRRMLGDDHLDTLTSMNNMGYLLQTMGKPAEAEPYCRAALDSFRRVLGDDHPDTLALSDNMGHLLHMLGKLAEAEPYRREALEGRRRVLGDDHPNTLRSMNNMGGLLHGLGKLTEAELYLHEAIEGCRRALGDDHVLTLVSIGNMGGLLNALGKPAEAEPYYREALEGCRRVLGDDHPDTFTSINNMGTLLEALGKPTEAEPYYREALDSRRRVLGDEHPDTLTSINNVGMLLRALGKPAEAEPYLREALDGCRRVLGGDHPDTLTSVDNMGGLLEAVGKPTEAEPYYREALDGRRRVLGDDHPDTLRSISNMGYLLDSMGKDAEAETYYREALDGFRRVLGDDHPDTLTSIYNMGALLTESGKLDEAEPLLLEGYRGWSERDGRLSSDEKRVLKEILRHIADLYDAQDMTEEARMWRAKVAALEIQPAEQLGESGTEELTTVDETKP